MNAFLALSVDKLSEIRDLEEDESKEKESEEKERKQREEQLTALKDPKVEIRRRTIRRLLRFQAHNPAERAKTISSKRRQWWGQLSLPYLTRQPTIQEFKRSASTPDGSTSAGRKLSMIKEERGAGVAEGVTKRPNPLSLMNQPPGFTSWDIEPSRNDDAPMQTAASTRMARMKKLQSPPPPIMEEREDEEDGAREGDTVFSPGKPRQLSILSSPPDPITTRTGSGRQMSLTSSEMMAARPSHRSHSLPVGSDSPGYGAQVLWVELAKMSWILY